MNKLSLRIALGAALLAIFVAVVFVSLIQATSEARRADRATHAGATLLGTASAARAKVAAAPARNRARVRAARDSALAVAAAADRTPVDRHSADMIRRAAAAFTRAPQTGRAALVAALSFTINDQQAESARRSSDLGDALTRALILGVIGLVGSVVSVALFGADMVRSVTLPVRRIAAAARRLGSGDFSTRVPQGGIADLKQLSQSLNDMAGSLEATRKKLDLQNAQLATSREDAQRANHAKSEFLSRMSHELRTPLNAILGFAQLLELDELDNRQRDNVDHIVAGGKHLLDLINEVLEISRIEAGSMIPVIEPLHAPSVVRDALELVAPLASQRGITLRAELDAHDEVWIAADRQRVKQVLLNLVMNAVKYNRERGSVTVSLKPLGERVQIRVQDTGPGIAPDKLPKLFTPFERLGAEGSDVEGTGLGLVLAQRLTEAMHGSLGVETQEWVGSVFHVELPRADVPAVPAEAASLEEEVPAVSASANTGEGSWRVLYVEDNAANARLMARLFQEEPRLELMTTMYGERGIAIAEELQPDLLLLDIHLPDIDGDEVLQRLRANASTSSIPVIVVSADATEEQRRRMADLGAAHYLTKPITLNALLSAVWDVLDRPVELLRGAEART